MESLTAKNSEARVVGRGPVEAGRCALSPGARRQLTRFVVTASLIFLGCGVAHIPYVSLGIFFYFFYRLISRRLDPVDVLVVVLAVEPWLGPTRFSGFHLDRGLVLLALVSLWSANGPQYRRFMSNKLDFTFCVFLVACALSAAFSFMYREPFRMLLESLVLPFGYYQVAKNCAQRADILPKLYIAAIIAVLGFGILGLAEAVTKVDYLSYGETAIDPFRISGPFRRGEDFGICMTLLLLFCFAMRTMRQQRLVNSKFVKVLPPLGIVTCYLTLTRGAWLGFTAGWLVQAARRNLGLVLKITPVLALLAWVFFKIILPEIAPDVIEKRLKNDRTVDARIATYKSALAMFVDHPVFGVGFAAFNETWERFPDRYQKVHNGEPSVASPHNIIMCLLSETGLIGVGAFVIFIAQAFHSSFRLARYGQSNPQREYAGFLISALTAYLVAGMGLHIVRDTDFISKYFLIFVGLGSGMIDSLGLRAKSRSARRTAPAIVEEETVGGLAVGQKV